MGFFVLLYRLFGVHQVGEGLPRAMLLVKILPLDLVLDQAALEDALA